MGWIKKRIDSEYRKHAHKVNSQTHSYLDWSKIAEQKIIAQLREDGFLYPKCKKDELNSPQTKTASDEGVVTQSLNRGVHKVQDKTGDTLHLKNAPVDVTKMKWYKKGKRIATIEDEIKKELHKDYGI